MTGILVVVGIGRGPGDGLGVLEDMGVDQNFYIWNAPATGDWTYWDAESRNPSLLARDAWCIPLGNRTFGMAAPGI